MTGDGKVKSTPTSAQKQIADRTKVKVSKGERVEKIVVSHKEHDYESDSNHSTCYETPSKDPQLP